jgi:hypothetical protein
LTIATIGFSRHKLDREPCEQLGGQQRVAIADRGERLVEQGDRGCRCACRQGQGCPAPGRPVERPTGVTGERGYAAATRLGSSV